MNKERVFVVCVVALSLYWAWTAFNASFPECLPTLGDQCSQCFSAAYNHEGNLFAKCGKFISKSNELDAMFVGCSALILATFLTFFLVMCLLGLAASLWAFLMLLWTGQIKLPDLW